MSLETCLPKERGEEVQKVHSLKLPSWLSSLFFQQIDADKPLIPVFPEFIPLTSFLKATSSLSWYISLSCMFYNFFIIIVQLVSPVLSFVTPWTAACQTSLPNQYLLEFAQTPVHWISDVIQSSHPLSPSSPPLPYLSSASGPLPMSRQLFTSGGQSIGASASSSVLPMSIQSWFPLRLTGLISCCPKDSQVSSLAPQFENTNSLVLSLLHGPTVTSIYDY